MRVGRWLLGVDSSDQPIYWDVTPALLRELVSNFNSQYAAGIYHPLQWGHSAATIGSTELSSVEYIRHLWIEGDTLYFGVYVSPDEAAELQRKHRQVSVRVVPQWQTQAGQSWGITLVHIAIVDHGAVPAQMPFVELAASLRKAGSVAVPRQQPFQMDRAAISKRFAWLEKQRKDRKNSKMVRIPDHLIRYRIQQGLDRIKAEREAALKTRNQTRRRLGLPDLKPNELSATIQPPDRTDRARHLLGLPEMKGKNEN